MRPVLKSSEVLLSLIGYNSGIGRPLRFELEPLPRSFTIGQDIRLTQKQLHTMTSAV
jgi:hypothetical protein